jgi:hypothetical protein
MEIAWKDSNEGKAYMAIYRGNFIVNKPKRWNPRLRRPHAKSDVVRASSDNEYARPLQKFQASSSVSSRQASTWQYEDDDDEEQEQDEEEDASDEDITKLLQNPTSHQDNSGEKHP